MKKFIFLCIMFLSTVCYGQTTPVPPVPTNQMLIQGARNAITMYQAENVLLGQLISDYGDLIAAEYVLTAFDRIDELQFRDRVAKGEFPLGMQYHMAYAMRIAASDARIANYKELIKVATEWKLSNEAIIRQLEANILFWTLNP